MHLFIKSIWPNTFTSKISLIADLGISWIAPGIAYAPLLNNTSSWDLVFSFTKLTAQFIDSSLSKSKGKVNILKDLKLKGKVHVIGDGYTDYEIKKEGLANYFYLFIENIKRESVVKSADYLLKSLDQFIKIIKWKNFHFQNQKSKYYF